MVHAPLLALLLPPVSYAPQGDILRAELQAEGSVLDSTLDSAARVSNAIFPFYAEQLLPDWERVCGISPAAGATYQQRLQSVIAKLSATGGLSIAYFISLAANVGYAITIDELEPFRAGINRAGEALSVAETIWVWRVNVASVTRSYQFRAGQSSAGERLLSFGDPVIEILFNELKPAHTFACFSYQG